MYQYWEYDSCDELPAGYYEQNQVGQCFKDWKGDGLCDCFMNNTQCNFDDGDCENGMDSWYGKHDIT